MDFPSFSFSRAFYLSYFSFSVTVSQQHHAVLVEASFVSVRLSSSLTSNLGVAADGGGGRVRMVVVMVGGSWFLRAYTAPYLSFLSLWEGEESPRSRALRTEFIIDRAISLTAPRRS